MSLLEKINESKEYIMTKLNRQPKVGMILGSGLGDMADKIENPVYINYNEIRARGSDFSN